MTSWEIKNKLKRQLREQAGNTIYNRGVGYFKSDHVLSMEIIADDDSEQKIEVWGSVSGTDEYTASFYFNLKTNRFSAMDCDCPYEYYCKHTIALGLKFVEIYWQFLEEQEERVFSSANVKRKALIKWFGATNDLDDCEGDLENKRVESKYQVDDKFAEKLRLLGIDPDNTSKDILKNLEDGDKQLHEGAGKNETQSLASDVSEQGNFAENYEIILKIEYGFYVKVGEKRKKNKKASYFNQYSQCRSYGGQDELEELMILKEKSTTKAQKKLLNFLKKANFWHNKKTNLEEFFRILKNSEMDIVVEVDDDRKEIKCIPKIGKKIKATLEAKYTKTYSEIEGKDISITQFFFGMSKDYFTRVDFKIITGINGLLIIDDKSIVFQKMSESLSEIVNRVKKDGEHYYNMENFIEIKLVEEELFSLNKIIADAEKFFNLKLKSPKNSGLSSKTKFKIKKFNRPKKTILVNYDSAKSSLQIYPAIDYGFYDVPVSKTVYFSRGKHYNGYKRRSFEKAGDRYVIDINLKNKTIFYAPVKNSLEKELYREVIGNYEKYGFTKTGRCKITGDKKIWKYHEKNWSEIKALRYPVKYTQDKFEFEEDDFKADFDVDFNVNKDWLAFDVDCYCGKNEVTLEVLRDYIDSKQEFIKMKDGKVLRVANRDELEKFVLMLESFYQRESSSKFEGKIYHAPELEDIFTSSDYYNAKLNGGFKKFMKEAQSGKPVEKVKLLANFEKIMRDYQREGIDWFYFLRKYRFAGILADDMGLGKTLQALALMDMNKDKVNKKPSLVVCPKTLLYNWQMEAKKFIPKMKTVVIDGAPKDRMEKIRKVGESDLVIISYPTLQRDLDYYKKQKISFNYCVLDEAQSIKNHRTKNARTVKQIDANYRLALTGTPLENTVEEIWSIFDFLMPGFLGSHKAFFKKFQKPIMKESNVESLKSLRQKTSCFMLRRSKKMVLKELPPKVENVNYCQLENSQNILYQEILANVKSKIFETVEQKGFAKSQIHILAGLTKLRQVCNHPVLLLKDKKYSKYESAKLEAFNELIEEIISSGKKVLVFSQFTKMLDILKDELSKKDIEHLYLSGQTRNRQDIIDKFNKEDIPVFLISLKAGGVGLNLTTANNVIIFDPWWNPSVENQAIDRTHRIGQKKSVNVYRLITKGTIEEKIVELQKKKQNLFDNLVGESKDMFKKLTWEDVQDLFK